MNRIIYIGMDVHSKTFSLCAMEPNLVTSNKYFAQSKFDATVENVVKYEKNLRKLLKTQM